MNLDELVLELKKKPFALFYGAGVSMDYGGPGGRQLLKAVKSHFPNAPSDSFFDCMDEIIDFRESNRPEVEKVIRDSLAGISARYEHKFLFSLPWRAVITTNYDRIPEDIGKTIDGRRFVTPIVDPQKDFPIDVTRPDLLYCFKMFGDVSRSYPAAGWMVLNSSDRNIVAPVRSEFYKVFFNLASSGSFLYLGYSFQDNIVLELLREMRHFLNTFPWSGFTILPSDPSPQIARKLQDVGITIIQGDLVQFVQAASRVLGSIPISSPSISNDVYVRKTLLRLDLATISNIWGKFSILDVKMLEATSTDPIKFLEGKEKSFHPFASGWDYPRKTKMKWHNSDVTQAFGIVFDNLAESRCRNQNSSDNVLIALIGSAGSGKSVIGRRLSFDWYQKGNPVVFINTNNLMIDAAALDSLLDEIWTKYKSNVARVGGDSAYPLRYLLLADDGAFLLPQLIELRNHLVSIGKPADIVVIARKSDITFNRLVESGVDAIAEVDDSVDSTEAQDFIDFFQRLNVIPSEEIVRLNFKNTSINSSFFSLIYTSVLGTQQTLEEILKNEYNKLDGESQTLYAIVSLLESQLLPAWKSLTLKSAKATSDWLSNQMASGRLGGVIAFDPTGNSLTTSNRVVAEIISKIAFDSEAKIESALSNIISAITAGDYQELSLLHRLLIERIEKGYLRLRSNRQIGLFSRAVEKVKSRPLFLHLAMVQMRADELDDANSSLRDAFDNRIPIFDEPDEHVTDARGRLELKLAEKAMTPTEKDVDLAEEHLERAQNFFDGAKINPIRTPHPYEGLARVYMMKAELALDESLAWNYLLLALQACANVEGYIGTDTFDLEPLKAQLIAKLDTVDLNEQKIRQIQDVTGRGNAYAFLAERSLKHEHYQEALIFARKGFREDAQSIWLMRLLVSLLKKLEPDNLAELKEALDSYSKIRTSVFDPSLSLQLAIETFKLDIEAGFGQFNELEQRMKYHPLRLKQLPENLWLEHGGPKEFSGKLFELPKYGSYGIIESTSDPIWGLKLKTPLRSIEFNNPRIGQRVRFNIIFNMVGPQASRVRQG